MWKDRGSVIEEHVDLPAAQVGDRRRRAAIRHVEDIDAGRLLEQFAGQVRAGAVAR
jgi:hypothetical protein